MVKRVLESSHGVVRKQDCGAPCSGFVTSVGQDNSKTQESREVKVCSQEP